MVTPSLVSQTPLVPQAPTVQDQPSRLSQRAPSPSTNFANQQMSQQGMPDLASPYVPNMQPVNHVRLGPHMNDLPNRTIPTALGPLNPGAKSISQTSSNVPNTMAIAQSSPPGTATVAAVHTQAPTQNQTSGQPPARPSAPDVVNGQQFTLQPLQKQTFLQAYKTWTSRQTTLKDGRLLHWENRRIDLYALHCEVIKLGGAQRVRVGTMLTVQVYYDNTNLTFSPQATAADQWPYIGAKLGFVNFPGTDTEPAMAGPDVAQHIQHVYKEFLAAFDSTYITSTLSRQRKERSGEQGVHAQAPETGNAPATSNQNIGTLSNLPQLSIGKHLTCFPLDHPLSLFFL